MNKGNRVVMTIHGYDEDKEWIQENIFTGHSIESSVKLIGEILKERQEMGIELTSFTIEF